MRSVLIVSLAAAMSLCTPAAAERLVYSPINPSFGGNPMNSSHLLSLASAQRTATAKSPATSTPGTGDGGTTPGNTDADLFVRQLQGRLLSALASQVTEAIFGTNPQDSGEIQFGDTKVSFDRSLGSIRLVIDDGAGGVTEIIVPQLVTSTPGALAAQGALVAPASSTNPAASLSPLNPALGGGSLTAGGL